jgi:hypothetical protein
MTLSSQSVPYTIVRSSLASATIQQIITPFESCSLILSNLPPNITQAEAIRIAEPFGDLAKLLIEEPNKDLVDPLKARIEYTSCNEAAHAVQNLNNVVFNHAILLRDWTYTLVRAGPELSSVAKSRSAGLLPPPLLGLITTRLHSRRSRQRD